jgi:hypothetical protein
VQPDHEPRSQSRLVFLSKLSDHAIERQRCAGVPSCNKIGVVQVPSKLGFQHVPPMRSAGDYRANFG